MDRLERLNRIKAIDASMPSEVEGEADDREIAILDKMVEENLTQVKGTK